MVGTCWLHTTLAVVGVLLVLGWACDLGGLGHGSGNGMGLH